MLQSPPGLISRFRFPISSIIRCSFQCLLAGSLKLRTLCITVRCQPEDHRGRSSYIFTSSRWNNGKNGHTIELMEIPFQQYYPVFVPLVSGIVMVPSIDNHAFMRVYFFKDSGAHTLREAPPGGFWGNPSDKIDKQTHHPLDLFFLVLYPQTSVFHLSCPFHVLVSVCVCVGRQRM